MSKNDWQSVIVALAYLALIVTIMFFCAKRTNSFDEFSKYWGLFAMIVGVATGAIPSFFFQSQTRKANEAAATAEDHARKASQRAELFAGLAPADKVEEIRRTHSTMFQ